jgi:hypothetical protein
MVMINVQIDTGIYLSSLSANAYQDSDRFKTAKAFRKVELPY